MLLTSVMNRPEDKNMLIAAPHSSLPDFVSEEARNCFCSVFPLVSKGESSLIFCRDFHKLAGACSRDPVIPLIIQQTLPHPFLSQNASSEVSYCKANINVTYHHKLHKAMLYALTRYQARSLFFLRLSKHMFHSSVIYT